MGYVIKLKNEQLTLREASERFNIPPNVLTWRLAQGWSNSQVLREPELLIYYQGKVWTPRMLSEVCGVNSHQLIRRYNAGMRGEDLVKSPDSVLGRKIETDNGEMAAEVIRERMKADCDEHLQRLRDFHPELERSPAKVSHSANGNINAGRLMAASNTTVRQYNRM